MLFYMASLKWILSGIGCAVFCSSIFASSPMKEVASVKDVEFSAAAGFSWSHATNNGLIISPDETDSMRISSLSNSASWKLGIGTHFFRNKLEQRNFINSLLVELNIYHSAATIKGNVWQYEMEMFNNYRFRAPTSSTRLMLDVKPVLFTYHSFSLYPILGIGASVNTMSYNETVVGEGVDPRSYSEIELKRKIRFAYDLGFGVRSDLNKQLSVSLEYIYANLGSFTPTNYSQTGTLLMKPPVFTVYNQAVLLGLTWKL